MLKHHVYPRSLNLHHLLKYLLGDSLFNSRSGVLLCAIGPCAALAPLAPLNGASGAPNRKPFTELRTNDQGLNMVKKTCKRLLREENAVGKRRLEDEQEVSRKLRQKLYLINAFGSIV